MLLRPNYYSALVLRYSHLPAKNSLIAYHKAYHRNKRADLTGMKTRRICSFKYSKPLASISSYTTRKYKEFL